MPAGLADSAVTTSCGAAIPTPPIDLEMGPMEIKLDPLAPCAGDETTTTKASIVTIPISRLISSFPPSYMLS